jgi:hypothetical protein
MDFVAAVNSCHTSLYEHKSSLLHNVDLFLAPPVGKPGSPQCLVDKLSIPSGSTFLTLA